MKIIPCVYLKHGAYWLVKQNRWTRLCSERQGLPAMYRALAALVDTEHMRDFMPAVIARWLESRPLAASTRKDYEVYCAWLGSEFAGRLPDSITTKDCADVLRKRADKPRTYTILRTILQQVLSFAASEGLRDGHNPVSDIAGKPTVKRKRLVLEDELTALREAAAQHRNGEVVGQLIDLGLLTAQRVGDLIGLRWQDVRPDGIYFRQQKTGKELIVQWTPKLRAVIAECGRRGKIGHVLKTQTDGKYSYRGIKSAWDRACVEAGIENLRIHDLRRRALMDAKRLLGAEAAQRLAGHSDPRQTADYTDGNEPDRVMPAG